MEERASRAIGNPTCSSRPPHFVDCIVIFDRSTPQLYIGSFWTLPNPTMPGSYFLPRVFIAIMIPLVLSSIGPTQSHPELGTDMAPEKRKNIEIFRSSDVQIDAALREYQKKREIVKVQAYRRGQKIHLKRREE